jgi:hypothetical protein
MAVIGDSFFERETIFGKRAILSYQTDDFGSIPQLVYKYLDLSTTHNKDGLNQGYLWFGDPNTFNDPFDCKTSFAYHLLAEDEALCRKYYEFYISQQEPNATEDEKKKLIDIQVNWMLSKKADWAFFKNYEKMIMPHLTEGISQFGIFCTSMINDNILLWSHYANKHRGICLGLKTEYILNKFYNKGEMGAGEVKYTEFPIVEPWHSNDNDLIMQTFSPFFLTKAKFWNYELEYRFVDYPCLDRKKAIKSLIASIYLGCDVSEEDEAFVKQFCKKNNENIELFKAEKSYLKYTMDFVQIDY